MDLLSNEQLQFFTDYVVAMLNYLILKLEYI